MRKKISFLIVSIFIFTTLSAFTGGAQAAFVEKKGGVEVIIDGTKFWQDGTEDPVARLHDAFVLPCGEDPEDEGAWVYYYEWDHPDETWTDMGFPIQMIMFSWHYGLGGGPDFFDSVEGQCSTKKASCPECGPHSDETIYLYNEDGEVTGTRPIWVTTHSLECEVCERDNGDQYLNDFQALKYIEWEIFVPGEAARVAYLEGGWDGGGWEEDIQYVDLIPVQMGDEVVYRYMTAVDGDDLDAFKAHPEWVRIEYMDGTAVSPDQPLYAEYPCTSTPDWYKLMNEDGSIVYLNGYFGDLELADELVELGAFEDTTAAMEAINEPFQGHVIEW